MSLFKIGLDFHGVIDRDPKFYSKLSKCMIHADGAEVHIITGNTKNEQIIDDLADMNISWTHFYSIEDDLIARGSEYKEVGGQKWFDEYEWDSAKGMYCRYRNISLHYDDTEKYGEYFSTPFMLV